MWSRVRAVVVSVLVCVLVLVLERSAVAGRLVESETIEHGGITRWFDWYEPDALPAGPVPLLIVLHGGTGSNDETITGAMGEFRTVADEEKFVVIYPNGTSPATGQSGPSGSLQWNDCREDAGGADTDADDVGFVAAVVDWAEGRWSIDRERVYAAGGSNGGMMAFRLAFELSDRFAAVAGVVANLPVSKRECPKKPARPISVLVMDGTEDEIMPWRGGDVGNERGKVVSAIETRNFWRTFLGIATPARQATLADRDSGDGGTVQEQIYCGGREGTQLAFYRVNGAGHTFPSIRWDVPDVLEGVLGEQNRDVETARVAWRFLARQRLSGTPGPCGDGCLDAGEVCDDGNTDDGDCCASDCTAGDTCTACERCDVVTRTCFAAPQTTCRTGTGGAVLLRDAGGGGDRLKWEWTGGDVVPGELGDPAATDDLTLCVFDQTPRALVSSVVPAGGRCAGTACWVRRTSGAVSYRDPRRARSPIQRAFVKPGGAGQSRIRLVGRGPTLGVPALRPLDVPLRVQLRSAAGGCWQSYCDGAGDAGLAGRFTSTCGGSPSGAFSR